MQLRYETGLTGEQYVSARAWRDARLDRCPNHPHGGCSLARHGYLARKAIGRDLARRQVADLLSILDVAPVNRAVLERAARSGIDEFEDAVIVESARQVEARVILTRNERDFAKSPIPVHSPISLPALLDASSPRA